MKKIFSVLMLSAIVAGCSTMYDRQSQFVFFNTPSVENAECYVTVGLRHYTVFPPERALIDRSDLDMNIKCLHNRFTTVEMTVSPKSVEAPRFTLDHLAQYLPALSGKKVENNVYEYPQVVTIDFGLNQRTKVQPKKKDGFIHFFEDETAPLSLTDDTQPKVLATEASLVQDTMLPANDLDGRYVY